MQTYDVLTDGKVVMAAKGRPLAGRVTYKETRYNLRRVLVTREWIGRRTDGTTKSFYTRKDAALWVSGITPEES